MAPVTNGRVLFNSIPTGYPEPGKTTVYDTSQTIDLENVPLNGGILLKTLVLSIDPYMRSRMRAPDIEDYSPPYVIGEPLSTFGVTVVVRSEHPDAKKGDHTYGPITHEQYIIRSDLAGLKLIENKYNLPWSVFIGAAGKTGQTAYMGWKEFSHAKKGEVAFVSTGAGAVGSIVIQLAKLDGLKVIASAGSDEKVAFMKELGADVAFNYKTTSTAEVLEKEGPIDIYWDNVGGDTLDAALGAATINSRFIECGMISIYNSEPKVLKNIMAIVAKSISMNGFIVGRLDPKHLANFYKEIPAKIASGELKYKEDVTKGLEYVGDALLAMLKGTNTGKVIVTVADD